MLSTILFSLTVGQLLTYGFLLAIVIFIIAIILISRDSRVKYRLIDLISNPDGTASLTRLLQLSAGVTGTWVVIKLTLANTLTVDIFGVYLAAMGISEGFTKWIQSKKGTNNDTTIS
jgi:hypothetical protein